MASVVDDLIVLAVPSSLIRRATLDGSTNKCASQWQRVPNTAQLQSTQCPHQVWASQTFSMTPLAASFSHKKYLSMILFYASAAVNYLEQNIIRKSAFASLISNYRQACYFLSMNTYHKFKFLTSKHKNEIISSIVRFAIHHPGLWWRLEISHHPVHHYKCLTTQQAGSGIIEHTRPANNSQNKNLEKHTTCQNALLISEHKKCLPRPSM